MLSSQRTADKEQNAESIDRAQAVSLAAQSYGRASSSQQKPGSQPAGTTPDRISPPISTILSQEGVAGQANNPARDSTGFSKAERAGPPAEGNVYGVGPASMSSVTGHANQHQSSIGRELSESSAAKMTAKAAASARVASDQKTMISAVSSKKS